MSVLGKLPRLNTLRLFASSYVGSKMTCPALQHFPVLRVLKLWSLEELKECTVEQGAMPQLVELEIRGCKKLEKTDGLEHLPALKELILTNMTEDFVADVRRRLGRDKLISRTLSTSHVSFLLYQYSATAIIPSSTIRLFAISFSFLLSFGLISI